MKSSEELVAEPPVTLAKATLIPVVRVNCRVFLVGLSLLVRATKVPEMVVVASPGGNVAIGIDGVEVPLEEVLAKVEGLEAFLNGGFS